MQPKSGGFPPMGFGPPPGAGEPNSRPGGSSGTGANSGEGPKNATNTSARPAQFRPGSFGFEFEYVSGDIQIGDQQIKNIGLRFKGNGTYMMSASNRKRPFKIDFDRYVDGQRFHGLQQLNLHNDVMDPTHLKSALSYSVFQAADIASPRTAFAELRLTIDGICDQEFLGLYSIVEEIDKAFLRRHYKTDKGMLLKPEGTQGLEFKGEDWEDYAWFEPKGKPTLEQKSKLIEITRIVSQPDDDKFRTTIESLLDIEQFARFLAANTLLSNMDSFLTQVHNYYLYLPTESNKFQFLPWDTDLAFGAFFFAGSMEQLQDLSITHPHVGQNRLIERLMDWDKFTKIYREQIRILTDKCFSPDGRTLRELAELRSQLEKPLAADAKRSEQTQRGFGPPGFGSPNFGPPGFNATSATIEQFVAKRRQSILDQLDGKSEGTLPGGSFGPGGPFGPPRAGGPGSGSMPDPMPGGPFPGGPLPSGIAMNPSTFFGRAQAPVIMASADTNEDKKVDAKEWQKLVDKWFKSWDRNADGQLDSGELSAGLNSSFAPLPPPPPPR